MNESTWVHDVMLLVTAALAAYAAWQSRRNGREIGVVRQQTDGMVGRIVEATARSAHLEGVKEGIAAVVQLPPNGAAK